MNFNLFFFLTKVRLATGFYASESASYGVSEMIIENNFINE
jgi:hypothetical protein